VKKPDNTGPYIKEKRGQIYYSIFFTEKINLSPFFFPNIYQAA